MSERLRSFIKRTIRHGTNSRIRAAVARAAFASMPDPEKDDLGRQWQMVSMESSLRQLFRLGFRPDGIVDVGAFQGDWTRMARAAFPDAAILMIEAQEKMSPSLEQTIADISGSTAYHIGLLGNKPGQAVEFFEMETGSTVMSEQSSAPRVRSTRITETLDGVIAEHMQRRADFLKLDVQGYELEVLKGGATSLNVAEVVVMEVSLIPINSGAPLLDEVTAFMADRGFIAYDICGLVRRPLDLALWQVDILFVKSQSPLRSRVKYD